DFPILTDGLCSALSVQASLDHLECVSLHIGQNKQEPILRGRQGTGLVHGTPTGSPGVLIEPPRTHRGLARGLKGRDEEQKRVARHAGAIEERCRARLQVSEPYTSHSGCLLASEAQHTGNRDKLTSYQVINCIQTSPTPLTGVLQHGVA